VWTIQQYIPNFVDIGDKIPPTASFQTLEELTAIPFVQGWTEDPGFKQLSMSIRNNEIRPYPLLMAEYETGSAPCVGHLRGIPTFLPLWRRVSNDVARALNIDPSRMPTK